MGGSMKLRRQCPKCQSPRVGYLETILDQQGDGAGSSQKIGKVSEKLMAFRVKTAAGETEAYICADCGYYETYIKNPDTISWDDMDKFHWLNPPATE